MLDNSPPQKNLTYNQQSPEIAQAELLSRQQFREATGTYTVQLGLALSASQLQAWQQKIADYQQAQTIQAPAAQLSIFDLNSDRPAPSATQANQPITQALNPFTLTQQNTEFWRWQPLTPGQPALYFVIDYHVPILLYVGETLDDQGRWRGEHGCKRYLQNYVTALRTANLEVLVGIGFWPGAAADRKLRQQQERELIYYWRSPFNKENWHYWHTPFVES